MTTATCGAPDLGLGPTSANGNAGRIVPLTAVVEPSLMPAPASANGNGGSVIPPMSAQPTMPGGSPVAALALPQVTAITLQQSGPSTVIVLEGQ